MNSQDSILCGYIVDLSKEDNLLGFLVFNVNTFDFEVRENKPELYSNIKGFNYYMYVDGYAEGLLSEEEYFFKKSIKLDNNQLYFDKDLNLIENLGAAREGKYDLYCTYTFYELGLRHEQYSLYIDCINKSYYLLIHNLFGVYDTYNKQLIKHRDSDLIEENCYTTYTISDLNVGDFWNRNDDYCQVYKNVCVINQHCLSKAFVVPAECTVVSTYADLPTKFKEVVLHKGVEHIFLPRYSFSQDEILLKLYISKDMNINVLLEFLENNDCISTDVREQYKSLEDLVEFSNKNLYTDIELY